MPPQVVERAVRAAGVEDEEWESRLNRGKRLAQEAEAKRRSRRDAQRALEDTISQQTAELNRLREEVRARSALQRRRVFEVSPRPLASERTLGSGRCRRELLTGEMI